MASAQRCPYAARQVEKESEFWAGGEGRKLGYVPEPSCIQRENKAVYMRNAHRRTEAEDASIETTPATEGMTERRRGRHQPCHSMAAAIESPEGQRWWWGWGRVESDNAHVNAMCWQQTRVPRVLEEDTARPPVNAPPSAHPPSRLSFFIRPSMPSQNSQPPQKAPI